MLLKFTRNRRFCFIIVAMLTTFLPISADAVIHEPHWQSVKENADVRRLSEELQGWLLTRNSLTARIRKACPDSFKLKVLQQKWQYPHPSEAKLLGIVSNNLVWVREVELGCNGQPWEFGRTVIPSHTLTAEETKLVTLGTMPIGEILFKDPSMQRSEFELAKLASAHYLYQQATRSVVNPPASLWGRRSVFYLHNKPLLITEVYTPWLPAMSGEINSALK